MWCHDVGDCGVVGDEGFVRRDWAGRGIWVLGCEGVS